MALSGRVVVRATTQDQLIFSWAAVQSAAANSSTVSWQMLLEAGQYGKIVASPGSPWSVTVDGKVFTGTSHLAIENNQTKVLAEGQIELSHDTLGNRSFDFSFSQEFWIHFDGESIRIVSGSGSAQLDTIPRASQLTIGASAVALGSPLAIYTNRVSSFTHTLEYSFGSVSGVIAQGVGDFYQWTPSMELARQIPNSVSGTAVITCTTYAGGTAIGKTQVSVTLTVPESVVPSASAQWEDLSGAYATVGTLVQNISRLRVDVSGTGAYGSAPVSSAVTLNGKAYGNGILTDAGANSLQVAVTDSRGRTGYQAYPLTVAAYSAPSLTVNASRCTADGTADEAGDCAKITVSGFVTQVNGSNEATLTVNWGASAETVTDLMGNISWQKVVAADPNNTMAISATLSDRLASATKTMTLSTGYATLDLLAGGKGIAFGKAATREGFDCAMPAFFTGGINGFFESESDPGCYYRIVDGKTEWVNPPMAEGVEYRTTERRNGAPVYVIRRDVGALGNNATVSIYFGLLYYQIVRLYVQLYDSREGSTMALNGLAGNGVGGASARGYYSGYTYNIHSFEDMSHRTAVITIFYTK